MSGIQSVSATPSYASVGTQSSGSLQPFANLNLTAAQRTQLRSILQSAQQNGTSQASVQQQIQGILTPAQQQTLTADLKASGGHHHHHGSPPPSNQSASASSSTSADSTDAAGSTDSTVLDAVTNVQNQAAAAQSTLVENLKRTLSTNGTTQSS
jgi:hypothetical protein